MPVMLATPVILEVDAAGKNEMLVEAIKALVLTVHVGLMAAAVVWIE